MGKTKLVKMFEDSIKDASYELEGQPSAFKDQMVTVEMTYQERKLLEKLFKNTAREVRNSVNPVLKVAEQMENLSLLVHNF